MICVKLQSMFWLPLALHIPDGFLASNVSLVGWVLAVLLIWVAVRHTETQFGEKQAPLMGVVAAFIFAAQAINFPIAAGTSGHVLGGALAGILMGPWAGILIMTAVIVVQGLLFQDGGLLVMGWNILSMGVFSVLAGYAAYSGILRLFPKWSKAGSIAAFVAAWLSVQASAVATAVALSVSGTFPLYLSLPSLTGIYALIGLGEGVVTAAAVSLLLASRPEVLQRSQAMAGSASASLLTVGLAICGILVLLSPYASQAPDGLETVAEAGGFSTLAKEPIFEVFPDYSVGLLGGASYSTVAALLMGSILVFSLVSMVGQFAARAEE